jgi:hypothetical protein
VDIWLLLLTVVGTGAALVAAVFSYLEWGKSRRPPDLMLRVSGVPEVVNNVQVAFWLELRNQGKGAARNWTVKVRTNDEEPGRIESYPRETGPARGYRTTKQRHVLEWTASAQDQVVGPRRDLALRPRCLGHVNTGATVVAEYLIAAELMPDREGTIKVRHEPGSVLVEID